MHEYAKLVNKYTKRLCNYQNMIAKGKMVPAGTLLAFCVEVRYEIISKNKKVVGELVAERSY